MEVGIYKKKWPGRITISEIIDYININIQRS